MPAKTTFIATAPDGTLITRTSARTYTHAVLVETLERPVGSDEPGTVRWGYLAFNSREELSVKEAQKWAPFVARVKGSNEWARIGRGKENQFIRTLIVPVKEA